MNTATTDLPVKTCSSNYAEKTADSSYQLKSAEYTDLNAPKPLTFTDTGITYQLLFGSDRLIA